MSWNRIIGLLILVGLFGATTGCQSVYLSNPVNVPLLTNWGETQASVQMGSNGYNLQTAFGVAPNVGLMVNGNFYTAKNDFTERRILNYFVEGGAGGYVPFGEYMRFETYAGYGYGRTWTTVATGQFHRVFFQPDFGVTTKYVDAAVATRFSWVNMRNYQETNNVLPRNQSMVYADPSLMLRFGYKNAKLVSTFSGNIPLTKSSNLIYTNMPFVFTLGFHINFLRTWDDE